MCGSAASIPRVARSSNGKIFFTIRTLAFTRLVGIEFRLFHALYFKQSPSKHSSRKISEPVQIKDLSEHEVWKKSARVKGFSRELLQPSTVFRTVPFVPLFQMSAVIFKEIGISTSDSPDTSTSTLWSCRPSRFPMTTCLLHR